MMPRLPLKNSPAILEAILESPRGVVIFALDCQYRYLAFNRNHQQTMKRIWNADIAFGDCMLDHIKCPEDRLKAKKNFDRVLSGVSFTLEEEYGDTALERRYYENIYNPVINENGDIIGLSLFLADITNRKRMEEERERLINELQNALAKVKTLSGLFPVCANCKKIRNDEGEWEDIEVYIHKHSEADFSHGICPECARKLYSYHVRENGSQKKSEAGPKQQRN
jgi:hypothetical protein